MPEAILISREDFSYGPIENNIAAKREAQNSRSQFIPAASGPRLLGKYPNRIVELVDKGVCVWNAVVRNVGPNFAEVSDRPRTDADLRQLFLTFPRFLLPGSPFNFFRIEHPG